MITQAWFTAEPRGVTGEGRTRDSTSQSPCRDKGVSDWGLPVCFPAPLLLPVALAAAASRVPRCLFLGFCLCLAGAPPEPTSPRSAWLTDFLAPRAMVRNTGILSSCSIGHSAGSRTVGSCDPPRELRKRSLLFSGVCIADETSHASFVLFCLGESLCSVLSLAWLMVS